MALPNWKGRPYRPVGGTGYIRVYKPDVNELLKPLSEKAGLGSAILTGNIINPVNRPQTTPPVVTPSSTPSVTSSPTPTTSSLVGVYTYNFYQEPNNNDVCNQNPLSQITIYTQLPLTPYSSFPLQLYTDSGLSIPYSPPSVPYFLGDGCGDTYIFIVANPNGEVANTAGTCNNPCPPTPSVTPTYTPTPSVTPTYTPTPSPTEPYDIYLFEECGNTSNKFRFENIVGSLTVGDVYHITGNTSSCLWNTVLNDWNNEDMLWNNCNSDINIYAIVIPYSATGVVYSGTGITFTHQVGCP